jgi:hypothetical protein
LKYDLHLKKYVISLFHSVQTGFGANPASQSMGTKNKASEDKNGGAIPPLPYIPS